jgi:hypothetical protein
MKTILKLSLVVLIAMTSINTYAINGDFLLHVKKGEGKEIFFSVNEIQKANVTIYDASYHVIYTETVTGKEGIARAYSLEEFPEGVYFLEVETNLKKVTHEIVVTTKESTLSKKAVAEMYKGDLKMKNENIATVN